MIVNRTTIWDDFAASEPYISDEDKQKVMDAAVKEMLGENGFYDVTIKTLLEGMHGEFAGLWMDEGKTVFDVYRVLAFTNWLKDFIALVDRLTLKPTAKQVKWSAGCIEMSFDESVYVFLRSYFGLHCFDDVQTMTVADYVLAKKDTYNKMIVERNQLQQ